MRHYCAIFDKNYLFQGVAVYKSLKHSSKPYIFYPLCMDDESYSLFQKMNLENVIPLKIEDIMTPELSIVQKKTTKGQFCWVCQPIVCEYILDKFNAEIVIYLEADSLFFADPEILLEELGDDSVSLVPHNYTPDRDSTATSGVYCVQFNAFKNNDDARAVLAYWRENCFEYTAERLNYFPGQLCLDNWPSFKGVKSLSNPGAGVAPWNSFKYKVWSKNNQVYVDDFPVVFYHYHQYGRYENGSYELGNYRMTKSTINLIYKPYVKALIEVQHLVHQTDPDFNFSRRFQRVSIKEYTLKDIKRVFDGYVLLLKDVIKRRYNVFPANYFDN